MNDSKKAKVLRQIRNKGYWYVSFHTTKSAKTRIDVMIPYTGGQCVSDVFLPDAPLAQIVIVMMHHIENFVSYR
jgi:hypothetical protein